MAAPPDRRVRGHARKFSAALLGGLKDYAEHQFRLDRRDAKGVSERERLQAIERIRKRRPKGLDGPPLPQGMAYLWGWFCALSNRRTYHASGPNPITPQDLETWARLTGRGAPSPGEAEAVFLLDDLWLSSCAEETKARLGKPSASATAEDRAEGRRRR